MSPRVDLVRHFRVTVSAGDVKRPKPHPDGYRQAFAAFAAERGACVVIEDSATGAATARPAGAVLVTLRADRAHGRRGDVTLAALADPAILAWAPIAARSPRRSEPARQWKRWS